MKTMTTSWTKKARLRLTMKSSSKKTTRKQRKQYMC